MMHLGFQIFQKCVVWKRPRGRNLGNESGVNFGDILYHILKRIVILLKHTEQYLCKMTRSFK